MIFSMVPKRRWHPLCLLYFCWFLMHYFDNFEGLISHFKKLQLIVFVSNSRHQNTLVCILSWLCKARSQNVDIMHAVFQFHLVNGLVAESGVPKLDESVVRGWNKMSNYLQFTSGNKWFGVQPNPFYLNNFSGVAISLSFEICDFLQ